MRRRLAPVVVALLLFLLVWLLRDARRAGGPESSAGKAPPSSRSPLAGTDRSPASAHRTQPPSSSPPEVGNPGEQTEVDRLIASIDWTSYGGAVLAFMRVQEDARRSGKPARQDPATIELLARENHVLEQIAGLLGMEDSREIRFHERLAPHYAVGWVKALGVSLSTVQEQDLRDSARAFARSRADASKDVEGANRLERLAWEAEQGVRWDFQVQKVLSPDQFARYAEPGGSDPFWGRQAGRRDLESGSVDAAAREVQQFWRGTFGLDPSSLPLLANAASEYSREAGRQIALFRAQFPGDAPREQQMRLQISLLRLQTAAERDLGKRLALTPQQLARISEGSGTVLVWR